MAEKSEELMAELRKRMEDVAPLENDEHFFTSHETLLRFLKSRDWNIDQTEKMLRATVEWRRSYKPLTADCTYCHEKPGFHSMRQVGWDEMGRPVIYCCFAQDTGLSHTLDDALLHATYLIENAKRTMSPGIHNWIFVVDCTGMTLPACNPKLGYGLTQALSNHYPERLHQVICIHHSALFHGVWKAICVFLHPNTQTKMQLLRSKRKFKQAFDKSFPEELSNWLMEEIALNKKRPLPPGQMRYWEPSPDGTGHDPRGCTSYVAKYLEKSGGDYVGHKPHPNIIDFNRGALEKNCIVQTPHTLAVADNEDSDSDSCNEVVGKITISEEYQIPKGATSLNM